MWLGRQKSEMPPTAELMLCATGSARAASGDRSEILMDAAQHEILLMARSDVTGRVRLADDQIRGGCRWTGSLDC